MNYAKPKRRTLSTRTGGGKARSEFEVLSKYPRGLATNFGKGTNRDTPVHDNTGSWHLLKTNTTKTVEEVDIKYEQIDSSPSVLVNMGKDTARTDIGLYRVGLGDDKCALDYDPNKEYVMTKTHTLVSMKKGVGRDNHFLSSTTKSITNKIDNYVPPSTLVHSASRAKVDGTISGETHATIDLTKTTGRSGHPVPQTNNNNTTTLTGNEDLIVPRIQEFDNIHHLVAYDKNYSQTDRKNATDYNMEKLSDRKPGFNYNWLTRNTNDNSKHYYDSNVKSSVVGTPCIKKTTGREKPALGSFASEVHDLDYSPKKPERKIASTDLFLVVARDEDTKSVGKAVDTLLARVNAEMRRNGISNKVRSESNSEKKKRRRTSESSEFNNTMNTSMNHHNNSSMNNTSGIGGGHNSRRGNRRKSTANSTAASRVVDLTESDDDFTTTTTTHGANNSPKLNRGSGTAEHFLQRSSLLEMKKRDPTTITTSSSINNSSNSHMKRMNNSGSGSNRRSSLHNITSSSQSAANLKSGSNEVLVDDNDDDQ